MINFNKSGFFKWLSKLILSADVYWRKKYLCGHEGCGSTSLERYMYPRDDIDVTWRLNDVMNRDSLTGGKLAKCALFWERKENIFWPLESLRTNLTVVNPLLVLKSVIFLSLSKFLLHSEGSSLLSLPPKLGVKLSWKKIAKSKSPGKPVVPSGTWSRQWWWWWWWIVLVMKYLRAPQRLMQSIVNPLQWAAIKEVRMKIMLENLKRTL